MRSDHRVRFATIWLSGCSGCHMSFLDQDELLIDLAQKVRLLYSPLVDAKEFPDEVGKGQHGDSHILGRLCRDR